MFINKSLLTAAMPLFAGSAFARSTPDAPQAWFEIFKRAPGKQARLARSTRRGGAPGSMGGTPKMA